MIKKTIPSLAGVLWLYLTILHAAFGAVPSKPNIIYILCDDLGYGDVQCLNSTNSKIPTPCMDKLASEGMVFTEAHSSSAVCTPSRYSIMTGRYCWRSNLQKGVLNGLSGPLISADRLTVPELLRQNGYSTAMIGKWHLGVTFSMNEKKPDYSQPIKGGPIDRGFDYYFGVTASADMPPFAFVENDHFTQLPSVIKKFKRSGPAAPDYEVVELLPTLTKKACEYISKSAESSKPFFLYLPLTSPHTPVAPTKEWAGKNILGEYGDFVMETDWAIGQVMDAIDRAGISQNTIVMLTSDNGCAPYVGVSEFEKKGHFASGDRRGYKSDIFDGGHHVPLIIRWPAKTPAGSVFNQTVSLTDLMATCADLLGVKIPDNTGEDSVSYLPALLGSTKGPLREAIVYHSISGSFGIQQGDWKLELCQDSGGWGYPTYGSEAAKKLPPIQLYNMRTDVGEKKNVEAEHPEIVGQLKKLLENYVANGRSTPGALRKNDTTVELLKSPKGKVREKDGKGANKSESPGDES